jgi:hypothetical protein
MPTDAVKLIAAGLLPRSFALGRGVNGLPGLPRPRAVQRVT